MISLKTHLLATTLLPVFLLMPDALVSGLIVPVAFAQQVTLTDPDGNTSVVAGSPNVTSEINPAEGETVTIGSGASISISTPGQPEPGIVPVIQQGVLGTGSTFNVVNEGAVETHLQNLDTGFFYESSAIRASETGGIGEITNTGEIRAIIDSTGGSVSVSRATAISLDADDGGRLEFLNNENVIEGRFVADSDVGFGAGVSGSDMGRIVNRGRISGVVESQRFTGVATGLEADTITFLENDTEGRINGTNEQGGFGYGISANTIQEFINRGGANNATGATGDEQKGIHGTGTDEGYGINLTGALQNGENSGEITGISANKGYGINADSMVDFANRAGGKISGTGDSDSSGDGESAGIRVGNAIDRLTNEAGAEITGSGGIVSNGIRAGSLSNSTNAGLISATPTAIPATVSDTNGAYGVRLDGDLTNFTNLSGGEIKAETDLTNIFVGGIYAQGTIDGLGNQNNAEISGKSDFIAFGVRSTSIANTTNAGLISADGGGNGVHTVYAVDGVRNFTNQSGSEIKGVGTEGSVSGIFVVEGSIDTLFNEGANGMISAGQITSSGGRNGYALSANTISNVTNGGLMSGTATENGYGIRTGTGRNIVNLSGGQMLGVADGGQTAAGISASSGLSGLTNEAGGEIIGREATNSYGVSAGSFSDSSNGGVISGQGDEKGYGINAESLSDFTNRTGGRISGIGDSDSSGDGESAGIHVGNAIDRLTNEAGAEITGSGGIATYGIRAGSLSNSTNAGIISVTPTGTSSSVNGDTDGAYAVRLDGDLTNFTNQSGGEIKAETGLTNIFVGGIYAQGTIDGLGNQNNAEISGKSDFIAFGVRGTSIANTTNAGLISADGGFNGVHTVYSVDGVRNFTNQSGSEIKGVGKGGSVSGFFVVSGSIDTLVNEGANGTISAGQITSSGGSNGYALSANTVSNVTNGGLMSGTATENGYGIRTSNGRNIVNLSGGQLLGVADGGNRAAGISASSGLSGLTNQAGGEIIGREATNSYGVSAGSFSDSSNGGVISGQGDDNGYGIDAESLSNFTNRTGGRISGTGDTGGSGSGESAGIRTTTSEGNGTIDRLTNEAGAEITGSGGTTSYGIQVDVLSNSSNAGTISGQGTENGYGIRATADITNFTNDAGGEVSATVDVGGTANGVSAGGTVRNLNNSGTISATVGSPATEGTSIGVNANVVESLVNHTGGVIRADGGAFAVGVLGDTSVNALENNGSIFVENSAAEAYGIDSNGDLSNVVNNGTISVTEATSFVDGGVHAGLRAAGLIRNASNNGQITVDGASTENYAVTATSSNIENFSNTASGVIEVMDGAIAGAIVTTQANIEDFTNSGSITVDGTLVGLGVTAVSGSVINFTNDAGASISVQGGLFTKGVLAGSVEGNLDHSDIIRNFNNAGTISTEHTGDNENRAVMGGNIEDLTNEASGKIEANGGSDVRVVYSGSDLTRATNRGQFLATGTSLVTGVHADDNIVDFSNDAGGEVSATVDAEGTANGVSAGGTVRNLNNSGTISATVKSPATEGTSTGINADVVESLYNHSAGTITASGGIESSGIQTRILSNSSNAGNISGEGGDNGYGVNASGDVTSFTNFSGGMITGTGDANGSGIGVSSGFRAVGAIDRLTNEAGATIAASGGTISTGVSSGSLISNSVNSGLISGDGTTNAYGIRALGGILNFKNTATGTIIASSQSGGAGVTAGANSDIRNFSNAGMILASGDSGHVSGMDGDVYENVINQSGGLIRSDGSGSANAIGINAGAIASLVNHGTILGRAVDGLGMGILVHASDDLDEQVVYVENYGLIEGTTSSIKIVDNSPAGSNYTQGTRTINNSGILRGGVRGIEQLNPGSDTDSIANFGTIEGGTTGIYVSQALGTIVNRGTIVGSEYSIFYENDTGDTNLAMYSGSTIRGLIDLGGGANTLTIGDAASVDLTFVTGERSRSTGTGLPVSTTPDVAAAPGAVVVSIFNENTAVNEGRTRILVYEPLLPQANVSQLNDLTGEIFSVVGSRISRAHDVGAADIQGFGAIGSDPSKAIGFLQNAEFWTQGFGSFRQDETDGGPAVNASLYGYALGADFDLAIGGYLTKSGVFAGGYVGSTEMDSVSDMLENEGFFLGAYTSLPWENHILSLAVTAGTLEASQERRIINNLSVAGFETASAEFGGWFVSPELRLGSRWELEQFPLETVVSIRHQGLFLDGFSETGALGQFTFEDTTSHQATLRAEVAVPLPFELADQGTIFTRFALGAEVTEQFSGGEIQGSVLDNSFSLDAGNTDTAISLHAAATAQYAFDERIDIDLHVAMEHELDRGFQYSARGGVSFRF